MWYVLVILLILGLAITYPWVALAAVLAALAVPVTRSIMKAVYFRSEEFQRLKGDVASLVAGHNEVAQYVGEIAREGTFELGSSDTGRHAHLATTTNTSAYNYKRDRNVAEYAPHVHKCGLSVVANAKAEPIKYLMKNFGVRADQETLADVQRVADSITRLEDAVGNIREREQEITAKINPPKFILKRYSDEFWEQIGVHLPAIHVPYPQYKWQYVSAGGNSSQETVLRLDVPTLEALAQTISDKIRWAKSAAGQRALMTARLRGDIKNRDDHTCQTCGISVHDEPHLLLEVDHIIPVSKGGFSVPENLQTLCWKCNRSKGAKIMTPHGDGQV